MKKIFLLFLVSSHVFGAWVYNHVETNSFNPSLNGSYVTCGQESSFIGSFDTVHSNGSNSMYIISLVSSVPLSNTSSYCSVVVDYTFYDLVSSCPSGLFPDPNGVCAAPVCADNDTVLPSLDESMCSGSATYQGDLFVDLYWQPCDTSCRGVFLRHQTCDERGAQLKASCDLSKNNFTFSCKDTVNGPVVNELKTTCTPLQNPCEDLYNRIYASCDTNTSHVEGFPECKTDGLKVLNPEVMKCVVDGSPGDTSLPKPSDCDSKWYETWNPTSSQCECDDGYTRSKWGICSKTLDANASASEKDSKNKNDQSNAVKKKSNDEQKKQNDKLNHSLENITDTLSGIRRDTNSSVSLLGSIKNLIGSISDKMDGNSSSPSYDMTESQSSLKSHYDSLISDIDSLKNTLSNGLVNPIPSGAATSCTYAKSIDGMGMSIPVVMDPCAVVTPYYSTLYNIWYFLFFVMFLVAAFKLLIFSRGE